MKFKMYSVTQTVKLKKNDTDMELLEYYSILLFYNDINNEK